MSLNSKWLWWPLSVSQEGLNTWILLLIIIRCNEVTRALDATHLPALPGSFPAVHQRGCAMNLACQWFVLTAEFFRNPLLRALWILSIQLCVHASVALSWIQSAALYLTVLACLCVSPSLNVRAHERMHADDCKLGGEWWHAGAWLSTAHLLSLCEWQEGDTLQLNKTWTPSHRQQTQTSAGWHDRQ